METLNPKINDPFIAVIGGANMDICGASTGPLVARDSNPGRVSLSPGGVARNIAENLSMLGANCRFLGAVGDDLYGDQLIRAGEESGIDMSGVLRAAGRRTSTYLAVLDGQGDMAVAINDMDIMETLTPEYIKSHQKTIKEAAAIVMDTNLTEAAIAEIAAYGKTCPIFVDVVSTAKAPKILPHLANIHTLKANREEAEAICGRIADLDKMAGWLHEKGVQNVIITLGAEGVYYSNGLEHGINKSDSETSRPVNATGAGDAFVAGLVFSYLQKWDMPEAIKFSTSAAKLAMAHEGTINPAMSVLMVKKIMDNKNGQ
ncbi:MAG: PfkB family carbohydrate kinase [Emcibacteraceae bacterium]